MDTAVGLVQAYLRVNGYFTVAEYPCWTPPVPAVPAPSPTWTSSPYGCTAHRERPGPSTHRWTRPWVPGAERT